MQFSLPYSTPTKSEFSKIVALVAMSNEDFTHLDSEDILEEYEAEMEKLKIPAHLQVHAIAQEPLLGKGVFLDPSAEPIEQYEFIGIYSGIYHIVLNEKEFDGDYTFEIVSLKMSDKRRALLNKSGFRLSESVKKITLFTDALKDGNFTRFINNSKNPNVEANIQLIRGLPQVVYRACRKIYPGEQLLVDYTDSYWKPLGITPLRTESDTYMLTKSGKIVSGTEVYNTSEMRTRIEMFKEKAHSLQPITGHTEFFTMLKEHGVDPRMYLQKKGSSITLSLRPGKKIRKGGFIGIDIPGTFCTLFEKSDQPTIERRKKGKHTFFYAAQSLTSETPLTI